MEMQGFPIALFGRGGLPILAAIACLSFVSCGSPAGLPLAAPPVPTTADPASLQEASSPRPLSLPMTRWNGVDCVELKCVAGLVLRDGRCVHPDGMPCALGCDPEQPFAEPGDPSPLDCRTLVVRAASAALARVDVAACRADGAAPSVGSVLVRFAATGEIVAASFVPPHAVTPSSLCVVERLRTTRIPAFRGDPVEVVRVVSLR